MDAFVLLASEYGSDGYEIVIGGSNNTQSAIRDGKQKPLPPYISLEVSSFEFHPNRKRD